MHRNHTTHSNIIHGGINHSQCASSLCSSAYQYLLIKHTSCAGVSAGRLAPHSLLAPVGYLHELLYLMVWDKLKSWLLYAALCCPSTELEKNQCHLKTREASNQASWGRCREETKQRRIERLLQRTPTKNCRCPPEDQGLHWMLGFIGLSIWTSSNWTDAQTALRAPPNFNKGNQITPEWYKIWVTTSLYHWQSIPTENTQKDWAFSFNLTKIPRT